MRRTNYFIRGYDYALRYAQAKYKLMNTKVFEKGIYAVNRIYLPNHCSLELLGNTSQLDGIIAGTISKEG